MSLRLWCFVSLLATVFTAHASTSRSLVSQKNGENRALLVSAANGLNGLDLDIKNMDEITKNTAFGFKSKTITDDQATIPGTQTALKELATEADHNGTLLFYFTGHGVNGGLYMGDQTIMKLADIREAIEDGRKGLGPVDRLVLMYDSCFSGSLVDPTRGFLPQPGTDKSQELADAVFNEFTKRQSSTYWKSLFVFASSRADETSMASAQGSIFTLALKKGFQEAVAKNGKMSDLVALTKTYTVGHHPVERFSPASLANETVLGD